jgi:hypothetical protein
MYLSPPKWDVDGSINCLVHGAIEATLGLGSGIVVPLAKVSIIEQGWLINVKPNPFEVVLRQQGLKPNGWQ